MTWIMLAFGVLHVVGALLFFFKRKDDPMLRWTVTALCTAFAIVFFLVFATKASANDCNIHRRFAVGQRLSTHHARHGTLAVREHHDVHALAVYAPIPVYTTYGTNDEALRAKDETIRAKDETLRAKDETIALLKGSGGGPLALKAPVASPGLAAFNVKCASCHDASVSKAKGNGNALFRDGQLVDEGDNVERIFAALDTGKMGSRDLPKITAQEEAAMLKHLMKMPTPTAAKGDK